MSLSKRGFADLSAPEQDEAVYVPNPQIPLGFISRQWAIEDACKLLQCIVSVTEVSKVQYNPDHKMLSISSMRVVSQNQSD